MEHAAPENSMLSGLACVRLATLISQRSDDTLSTTSGTNSPKELFEMIRSALSILIGPVFAEFAVVPLC